MLKILNRNSKKGFTLVEVIVVLVILAILAAILIPSMIGWINKAEEKTAVVEARTVLLAAQTIVSENYNDYRNEASKALTDAHITEAIKLADVGDVAITASTVKKGQITNLTVTSTGGKTVVYAIDATTGAGSFDITG